MIELKLFLRLNEDIIYTESRVLAKDLVKSHDFLGEQSLPLFKNAMRDYLIDFIGRFLSAYSKEFLMTELTDDVIIHTLGEEYLSPKFWRKI